MQVLDEELSPFTDVVLAVEHAGWSPFALQQLAAVNDLILVEDVVRQTNKKRRCPKVRVRKLLVVLPSYQLICEMTVIGWVGDEEFRWHSECNHSRMGPYTAVHHRMIRRSNIYHIQVVRLFTSDLVFGVRASVIVIIVLVLVLVLVKRRHVLIVFVVGERTVFAVVFSAFEFWHLAKVRICLNIHELFYPLRQRFLFLFFLFFLILSRPLIGFLLFQIFVRFTTKNSNVRIILFAF